MYGLKSRLGGSQKGQLFLIGSIIIVIIMVLLRTSIDVTQVLENKRFLESGVENQEFENLRREVPKSAFNALNASANMTNVTNSFIAFADRQMSARTIELEGVSVNSQYDTLSASTDEDLNVTIFNFFEIELRNAVLNLSTDFDSPVTFSNIPPGATRSNNFTVNIASNSNLTLWVFYETSLQSVVQNITIPADIDRTKFVGYFDLRMSDERGEIRDRFVQTVEVN